MVIGYLMHERRWRLQEAFKWVCDRRPTVKLSPGEQGACWACLLERTGTLSSFSALYSCVHAFCTGPAEESKRLQELEVALLGSSSTGYQQGSLQLQAGEALGHPSVWSLHGRCMAGLCSHRQPCCLAPTPHAPVSYGPLIQSWTAGHGPSNQMPMV